MFPSFGETNPTLWVLRYPAREFYMYEVLINISVPLGPLAKKVFFEAAGGD